MSAHLIKGLKVKHEVNIVSPISKFIPNINQQKTVFVAAGSKGARSPTLNYLYNKQNYTTTARILILHFSNTSFFILAFCNKYYFFLIFKLICFHITHLLFVAYIQFVKVADNMQIQRFKLVWEPFPHLKCEDCLEIPFTVFLALLLLFKGPK